MVGDWSWDPGGYLDAIGLFYDTDQNVFVGEDGFIVWSIFELITPNDLLLFRERKDYMVVDHRTLDNVVVELYYPNGDDDD